MPGLADYVEYLTGLGLGPSTIRIYVRHIRHLNMAGIDPTRCTAAELATYALATPATYSTRSHLRSAVQHWWDMVGRFDRPRRAVPVPPKPRMFCQALEPWQAKALVKAADRWHPQGTAVLLGLYLALRRFEIARARWDGFDRDMEWYSLVGKLDVSATLPVHPRLAAALARIPRDSVWLFPGHRGRDFVCKFTITKWVGEVAAKAGVGHVKPHQLRHTAIATVHDATGDLRTASTFARHARVETTMIYTRTTTSKLRRAVESLDYG